MALALEVRNFLFNMDSANPYLATGVESGKTLQNWSGAASLDIYLGGRKYDDDQVSRAYRETFGDGFRGLKFVVEPGIAYLNMRDEALIGDTWLLGGSVGVDFSDLFGVRGFYYRETKDANKLSLDLGKHLEMYGGNLIGRLNIARGVTPYLNLGAGYLKTNNTYVDTQGNAGTDLSGWFALGGVGIEIPLHRTIALYGVANAILLEQDNPNIETVTSPSAVNVNWLMQGGVRINIGASSRSGVKAYQSYASRQVDAANAARLEELNALRSDYEARIEGLNADLVSAAERLDTTEMALIAARKVQAAQELKRVDEATTQITNPTQSVVAAQSPNMVVMTASQLESLITRVLQATDKSAQSVSSAGKLSDMDKILLIGAMRNGQVSPALMQQLAPAYGIAAPATTSASETAELLKRLESIETRLRQVQVPVQTAQPITNSLVPGATSSAVSAPAQGVQSASTTSPTSTTEKPEAMYVAHLDQRGQVQVSRYEEPSFLRFRSVDVYAGLGFDDASTVQLGIRPQWSMGTSRFNFAPEMFVSVGSGTGYGLGASIIYKSDLLEHFHISPYAGLGLGYSKIGDHDRFGFSGVVGLSFDKILGGRFFVDYSLRPTFRNHHFSAGYSFVF